MSDRNNCNSQRRKSRLALLLVGASYAALGAAMPAFAQDAVDDAEAPADEVVVTGIRRSLQSAQDIKQNADTFVDAVTSEDIGALPDRSVTEALQRIPGVTISRFAAADDPDHFSIEGTGVVVRGLSYVRSELNGRDTFSANNGRALSFSDVSPELLGSVQVFKNQTADLIEGGIAGTVNLVTRKPFDQKGSLVAGTLEYNYSDFREKGAITASGLVSNSWETPSGRFGFLLSAVTSDLKTRSDGTQASSFQPRTDLAPQTVWIPEGAAIRTQDYDRGRLGLGGSAQWESNDGVTLATFEFLRSEATTSWNEHASEIATDNVGDTAFFYLPGTQFGYDSNDLFSYGTISAPVGWRDDQFSAQRTPIYGLQSNNIKRGVEQEYVTSDYSFNVKIAPTDRLSANFDFQYVKSTVTNVDVTIWGSSYQDIGLDLRSDIPDVVYLPPNETGDGVTNLVDCSGGVGQNCPSYFDAPFNSFADPYNTFWRAAMDHFEDSGGDEKAFRADIDYDLDEGGFFKSVRVGGRLTERDQTTRFSTYNWGALSEIWGNGGPVWMDQIGAPEGLLETFTWPDFQRGQVTQPPALPFYAGNPAQDYGAFADFADLVAGTWRGRNGLVPEGGGNGWIRLDQRPGVIAGTPYLPGEVADTFERTAAAYVKLDFASEDGLGGVPFEGNIGLRYVRTTFKSDAVFQYPNAVSIFPNDSGVAGPSGDPTRNQCLPPTDNPTADVPGFCALSQAERDAYRAFADNNFEDGEAINKYASWLPSLNVKFDVGEGQLVRFAYSKSINRPDLGLMRNNFTFGQITGDDPRTPGPDPVPPGYSTGFFGFTANGGNAFLQPIKSHNFDLSYEWYFADVGSLTVSGFYKFIDDIIVAGEGDVTFTHNGATLDVFTRQPTNSDQTGKVRGFEVAYQQFYDFLPQPFDGFGLQASYTFIDSTGVNSSTVNPTNANPANNSALVDLSQLPLQGLSKHNYNVAAIYEKGIISTRVAYNWRSDYLVTPRDVITPFYPIFQRATGQLDASLFVSVTPNVKVGVQGANLLNEITITDSFIPNSDGRRGGRSWYQNDRRVTASLRVSF